MEPLFLGDKEKDNARIGKMVAKVNALTKKGRASEAREELKRLSYVLGKTGEDYAFLKMLVFAGFLQFHPALNNLSGCEVDTFIIRAYKYIEKGEIDKALEELKSLSPVFEGEDLNIHYADAFAIAGICYLHCALEQDGILTMSDFLLRSRRYLEDSLVVAFDMEEEKRNIILQILQRVSARIEDWENSQLKNYILSEEMIEFLNDSRRWKRDLPYHRVLRRLDLVESENLLESAKLHLMEGDCIIGMNMSKIMPLNGVDKELSPEEWACLTWECILERESSEVPCYIKFCAIKRILYFDPKITEDKAWCLYTMALELCACADRKWIGRIKQSFCSAIRKTKEPAKRQVEPLFY